LHCAQTGGDAKVVEEDCNARWAIELPVEGRGQKQQEEPSGRN
jgi:hypothetical protein